MDAKEVQFHAALLVVGPVPYLKAFLSLSKDRTPGVNYKAFREHKARLIGHLERADYFDVYYQSGRSHETLTEKAALWIGEFYQWLMAEQKERALS